MRDPATDKTLIRPLLFFDAIKSSRISACEDPLGEIELGFDRAFMKEGFRLRGADAHAFLPELHLNITRALASPRRMASDHLRVALIVDEAF
jgi:hypothetical protein